MGFAVFRAPGIIGEIDEKKKTPGPASKVQFGGKKKIKNEKNLAQCCAKNREKRRKKKGRRWLPPWLVIFWGTGRGGGGLRLRFREDSEEREGNSNHELV